MAGGGVRCPGRARHWFVIRRTVGLRSPVCVSCGTPCPRPLTGDEWAELAQYREAGGGIGKFAGEALRAHQEQLLEDRRRAADTELVRRNAVSDQQEGTG